MNYTKNNNISAKNKFKMVLFIALLWIGLLLLNYKLSNVINDIAGFIAGVWVNIIILCVLIVVGVIGTVKIKAKYQLTSTINITNEFEDIKHTNEDGQEYWLARELQQILSYARWEAFQVSIEKAKEVCINNGNQIEGNFTDTKKTVLIGAGVETEIEDMMLSSYACHLIVMNEDPSKKNVKLGQTYFTE